MMTWQERLRGIPRLGERTLGLFFGVTLMGLAVNLLRFSMFGTDTFPCMNLGFSNVTGLSFGTCVILFSLVFLVWMCLCERRYVGLGTLVNMFYLGVISDVFYALLAPVWGAGELDFLTRVLLLVVGIPVNCLRLSFYMGAGLGMSPYDALAWIIADHRRGRRFFAAFRSIRIALDMSAVAIGFSLGSVVGIGTVVTAFFAGPLIQFFLVHFSRPLMFGRASV